MQRQTDWEILILGLGILAFVTILVLAGLFLIGRYLVRDPKVHTLWVILALTAYLGCLFGMLIAADLHAAISIHAVYHVLAWGIIFAVGWQLRRAPHFKAFAVICGLYLIAHSILAVVVASPNKVFHRFERSVCTGMSRTEVAEVWGDYTAEIVRRFGPSAAVEDLTAAGQRYEFYTLGQPARRELDFIEGVSIAYGADDRVASIMYSWD